MILSLDVGFKNTGWVIFHNKELKGLGIIQTEKADKKGVRIADDNSDRAQLIGKELNNIINAYKVEGIIGELPSGGSQNAKASNQMGIATGVVSTVVVLKELPCEWCTPTDVKKVVTGKRSATKDEIMENISEQFNFKVIEQGNRTVFETPFGKFNKGKFEHIADAFGTYLALKNNNLVKMFG